MEKNANRAVPSKALLDDITAERDKLQEWIDKGKGTWPESGYVRDEAWAGWQHTRTVLNGIIRRHTSNGKDETHDEV